MEFGSASVNCDTVTQVWTFKRKNGCTQMNNGLALTKHPDEKAINL